MFSALAACLLLGVAFANPRVKLYEFVVDDTAFDVTLEKGKYAAVFKLTMPETVSSIVQMKIDTRFCESSGVGNFVPQDRLAAMLEKEVTDEEFAQSIREYGVRSDYMALIGDHANLFVPRDYARTKPLAFVAVCSSPNMADQTVAKAVTFAAKSPVMDFFQTLVAVLPGEPLLYIINRAIPWGLTIFAIIAYLIVFIIVWLLVVLISAIILCCTRAEYDGCRALPAALLLYIFPFFGLHHLYMHHCWLSLFYFLTLGVCGLWAIVDAFALRKELNHAFSSQYSSI